MDKPVSYDDAFQKLRGDYLARLGRDEASLCALLPELDNPASLAQARHIAHGLSGSGTTFGFSGVSAAGKEADLVLTRMIQDESGITAETLPTVRGLLSALADACRRAMQNDAVPETTARPPGGSANAGAYVLLVDDDRDLAAMLSERLGKRGIHVVVAATGAEALKILERQSPDLMILDVMMPGLSGHDVLKHLNYDGKFAMIPVIMLSANAQQDAMEQARRLGVIDYIPKPVAIAPLMQRVDHILDAAGYHVLIADNDRILLTLLQQKFHQRGFRVSVADDGKIAWDMVFRDLPDLVILDRMMPGMDGLAVLKNIRSEPETEDIPVIVVSARKEERDIQIGLKMGAQDYVSKPCDPEDLVNRSLALLQQKAARQPRRVRNH